jgi:hypothetical protein
LRVSFLVRKAHGRLVILHRSLGDFGVSGGGHGVGRIERLSMSSWQPVDPGMRHVASLSGKVSRKLTDINRQPVDHPRLFLPPPRSLNQVQFAAVIFADRTASPVVLQGLIGCVPLIRCFLPKLHRFFEIPACRFLTLRKQQIAPTSERYLMVQSKAHILGNLWERSMSFSLRLLPFASRRLGRCHIAHIIVDKLSKDSGRPLDSAASFWSCQSPRSRSNHVAHE